MTTTPRILIVKMSSLGDLFHALPTVHDIKQGLGGAVDWVVHDAYVDIASCFRDVDRVIAYPRNSFFSQMGSYLCDLREREYTHIIDLQGLMKSAFAAKCAKGSRRIGPSFTREGSHLFYTELAEGAGEDRHAVEQCRDVSRHLKLELGEPVFPVSFPEVELQGKGPRIGLVPCSRWKAKNWAAANFAKVARVLQDELKATIFLFGSPDDRDVCADIERQLDGVVINHCGQTNLVELGSIMQNMDLAISVDSGPMHMAAACGVPVVAVFGTTDPGKTGPYGDQHRVIQPEGVGRIDHREYKVDDDSLINSIDPERVWRSALEILQT